MVETGTLKNTKDKISKNFFVDLQWPTRQASKNEKINLVFLRWLLFIVTNCWLVYLPFVHCPTIMLTFICICLFYQLSFSVNYIHFFSSILYSKSHIPIIKLYDPFLIQLLHGDTVPARVLSHPEDATSWETDLSVTPCSTMRPKTLKLGGRSYREEQNR